MGLPRNNALAPLAKQLRMDPPEAEKRLWYKFLREYPIPFRWQKVIGNYIVDFFCNRLKLSIELDGSQHYTPEGRLRDDYRTRYLELLEIKELRFTDAEVFENLEGVCEVIHTEIEKLRPDVRTASLSAVKDKR